MADTPQKPREPNARERGLDKIQRGIQHTQTPADLQMHRGGALRMLLIALFAFIFTFRNRYKVVLEFGGDNHIDVTESLLMRVRIVSRNGVDTEDKD